MEEHKDNLGTVTSSTFRWYVYDGLGSVIAELNGDGTMDSTTVERQYDVFGQVRRDAGGASTSKHKFVGGLGHQSEGETGMVYMQARYMDPETGRFVSEDPARDGNNWFVYCADDPVDFVDADGRVLGPFGTFMRAILYALSKCSPTLASAAVCKWLGIQGMEGAGAGLNAAAEALQTALATAQVDLQVLGDELQANRLSKGRAAALGISMVAKAQGLANEVQALDIVMFIINAEEISNYIPPPHP